MRKKRISAASIITTVSLTVGGTISMFAVSPQQTPGRDSASSLIMVRWLRFSGFTCLEVFPDRGYRLEKSASSFPGSSAPDIFEGVLREPKMEQLSAIIDDKDFEAIKSEIRPIKPGLFIMNPYGQLVGVEVNRGSVAQKFVLGDPKGMTAFPPAIKPLEKWIEKFKPEKSERIRNGKPTICPYVK